MGVIGPNGAGKSTLLKILTRITTPTQGSAVIRGRVGSLLEVGTGFHGELTGRENIYLNGSILGMTRREITRKLPEIVEFSGVSKFIDTPVKRYSSGMYVRLAFSVAAHLEPEILLVDEVLAVGDAEFQRRCLGRMEELSRHGRTVLFVSHNMQVLARLCDRAILLREGRIVKDGPSDEVVAHYLQTEIGQGSQRRWPDLETAPGGKRVRLREVRVVDEKRAARGQRRHPPAGRDRDHLHDPARRRRRLPEDQGHGPGGQQRLQHGRHEPALEGAAADGRLRGHGLDPGQPPERGPVHGRAGRLQPRARRLEQARAPGARYPRPSPSTSTTPGRETRRRAGSPGSSEAPCARCSSGRRSTGDARTPPVLLHVGYHKTGSRWLRGALLQQPEHGLRLGRQVRRRPSGAAPRRRPAARVRRRAEPRRVRAAARSGSSTTGLSPVVSFERFSGNPFSGGYDSKEIADRLVEVFPGARVLVVVREQRSMIVSTYKQYVREGGALSPSKFMLPPTSRSLRVPWFDLRHFEYHHLLGYYRRLFGPEAVLALAYEQFVADPRAFVDRIARFAGRPLATRRWPRCPFDTRTNPGPPATAITVRRVLNGLGVCTDLNPAPPLASPVFWRLGKRVDRLSLAPRQAVDREEEKLRRTVEEIVGDRYVDSNRQTAELLGVDLGAYGWMI